MDRTAFEVLRDYPGKVISCDVRFVKPRALQPFVVALQIPIENADGHDLRMNINYNPETRAKTINVSLAGLGPICRLDVDGPAHRPAGRSHKHSLQSDRCPDRNLPDGVVDRPELLGSSLRAVFETFCAQANIAHSGVLYAPDETPT